MPSHFTRFSRFSSPSGNPAYVILLVYELPEHVYTGFQQKTYQFNWTVKILDFAQTVW